ncbi:ATP-dependent DNA helicase RecG [Methylolobus aquaticus]
MPAPALESLPIDTLKGIGHATRERLGKLGLLTLFDLLVHLPLRYENRTELTPIAALVPGARALVNARVAGIEAGRGRRRSVVCRLEDETGTLYIRLFHYSATQLSRFIPGAQIQCFGEVRIGLLGAEMIHPEYRFPTPDGASPTETRLTPVYPIAEGLRQRTFRGLVEQTLQRLDSGSASLHDPLAHQPGPTPAHPPLPEALHLLHQPGTNDAERTDAARERLAFEELLAHRLSMLRRRVEGRQQSAPVLALDIRTRQAFESQLPFALTAAQQRVSAEIGQDLQQTAPMMRLLQGDVGSGKTVVAALAALTAAASQWQTALMAPTELLAEQHFANLSGWLKPLGVEIVLMLGRYKSSQREERLARVAEGRAGVVIGTHALFQRHVAFHRLGLVIIDEQHRFGVHQRLALRAKGDTGTLVPHQLIMTATPIPRTRAMIDYADLDLSIIDALPPGRTPVRTIAMRGDRREEVVGRIADWVGKGRQAYWVCALIEESETLQCEAAEKTAKDLSAALGGIRIGLVHGRMRSADKESVMQAFKRHEFDLLVATTVIEVGVDVPNAGLMIIENAERFGLSQLHQLRGRVGRGAGDAFCVLLYQPPLGTTARQRLDILRESNDGFAIAEKDWELRGSGELLGTRQTGSGSFRVATLPRDAWMLPRVAEAADRVGAEDPTVPALLHHRWIGRSIQYAEV